MTRYELVESEVRTANDLTSAAAALAKLLSSGFSVWTDGSLYDTKQLVDRVGGLKIEVFAREHPPPHFHISGDSIDATFSLTDCSHLEGEIGSKDRRLVEWWYERSRATLIRAWNASRPSDCPVGPIPE